MSQDHTVDGTTIDENFVEEVSSSQNHVVTTNNKAKIATQKPALTDSTLEQFNRLFNRSGDVVTDVEGQPGTWQFKFCRQPQRNSEQSYWVQFVANEKELWLRVDESTATNQIGERHWQDYDDHNRMLAWAINHEIFIQHLNVLHNEVWTPAKVVVTNSEVELSDDSIPVVWYLNCALGEFSGVVFWHSAHVDQVVSQPHWQQQKSVDRFNYLPVHCQLLLPGYAFPLSDFEQFEAGDLIMVAARRSDSAKVRLQPRNSQVIWLLEIGEGGFKVSEGPKQSEPTVQPEEVANVNAIPIQISFELAELSLPLNELQNLQPGYVLKLGKSLEHSEVKVLANGLTIGTGDIVTVGDQLAVQLTELVADGI